MRNRMRTTALLLAAVLCLENITTNITVYATETESVTETTESAENTEVTEPTETVDEVEETETTEATGETEVTEEIEVTEVTEETEETEVTEETETNELVGNALAAAEDPQSGTSMSNEEDTDQEYLGSYYQASSYTGLTYLHNSRYESGYTVVNGIDVSKHNGSINWSAVKAAGIDYAIIRVGYRGLSAGGLYEDPMFTQNIQGALAAGMKVGVYIFSQAITETEAQEEAHYIASRISGYNITLPVVIDYEYGNNHSGRLAEANLSSDAATAVVNAFCVSVKNYGYTPMVYANKSMLQSDIRGTVLDDYYKIWLANYTTETTYGGDYYAWQYSSKGSVNGISGYVDCDFFYEENNLNNAKLYVASLYKYILEREPDDGGLSAWAGEIVAGRQTACSTAQQFIEGAEYTGKNDSDANYVKKLYRSLLGREASDTDVAYWSDILANGVSRRYVLQQITNSNEFTNVCSGYGITKGSISVTENRDKNYNATAYVMRCYKQILGRSADASGLNTWTGKLLNGNGGAEIVKDLITSQEFQNKKKTDSQFLDILYRSMLGRNADAGGKKNWTDVLSQGVSYVYIINGFAESTEFKNICQSYGINAGKATITEVRDQNINVTGFVNRCYKKSLERSGDTDGLNNWCGAIISGVRTPAQVAYGFVFSDESNNKNRSNEEFVEMLYNLCLDRSSDAPGKANWVNQLKGGTSRETVFWGFANSQEFQQIVAGYGL